MFYCKIYVMSCLSYITFVLVRYSMAQVHAKVKEFFDVLKMKILKINSLTEMFFIPR